jgi:two-component system phosphate regulon response regulator PhoB
MNTEKKRIMIIDDEAGITRLLKLNLELTSLYEVCAENDPDTALAAARKFRPDLILLDVFMPGITGDELASQFRAVSELKDVPIVFLTAAIKPAEVRAHHGHIGPDFFLAKPVDLNQVLACLKAHLPGTTSCAAVT